MVLLQFVILIENLERASVSLLMLSAKQGNHCCHFFIGSICNCMLDGKLYIVGQHFTQLKALCVMYLFSTC